MTAALADSDLEELISSRSTNNSNNSSNNNANKDSDKYNKKYSSYFQPSSSSSSPSSSTSMRMLSQIPTLLMYYLMTFLLQYPRCAKLVTGSLFAAMLFAFISLTSQGKTEEIGYSKYDVSQIKSRYDFDIGSIDHWCVDHSEQCLCEDPLIPSAIANKNWNKTHRQYAQAYKQNNNNIDVAFIGQSVVEALNGKHNSVNLAEDDNDDFFGPIQHIFQKKFKTPTHGTTVVRNNSNNNDSGDSDSSDSDNDNDNHDVYGVALGIAGDQANNILWRLMHGELNDNFNPPVWWLVIGMEDLARYKCSEDIVIMGILRIVEEIKNFKPDAKIVINGLFPIMSLRLVANRSGSITTSNSKSRSNSNSNSNAKSISSSSSNSKSNSKYASKSNVATQEIDFIDATRKHHNHEKNDRRQSDRKKNDRKHKENKHEHHNRHHNRHNRRELRNKSDRKKDKELKHDLLNELDSKFKNVKQTHKEQERMIFNDISETKRNKHLSKEEKHKQVKELISTYSRMRKDHHETQQGIIDYMEEIKKERYNPVMKEKHTFHKDNLFHHHKHNSLHIPVWTAVTEINKQLHTFCKNTDQVAFYDPTPLFTIKTENGDMKLLTDLMSPRGHPTKEGYKVWLNDIQRKIIEWKKVAEEQAKENDEMTNLLNQYYYPDGDEDDGMGIGETTDEDLIEESVDESVDEEEKENSQEVEDAEIVDINNNDAESEETDAESEETDAESEETDAEKDNNEKTDEVEDIEEEEGDDDGADSGGI
jgi:hypothetical protein